MQGSTEKLLEQLGHDVQPARSAKEALHLLHTNRIDLLVLDSGDEAQSAELISEIFDTFSPEDQPRQMAVFSRSPSAALQSLRQRTSPLRVHIFFEPLHVHGLLNVIKSLDNAQAGSAA